MSILKWADGETHEFIVIGKVGAKRHFNKQQQRSVLCTGKKSCWFCQHGFDYQGVTIGIAIYSPEAIEESHYPWVNFTPIAYKAIRQVLGNTKNWYSHRIQLTRKGLSFDTTYSAKDLGPVEDKKLDKWVVEREKLFAFDAGEEWGEEEPAGEEPPPLPAVPEEPPDLEEDRELEKGMLQETLIEAQKRLEELEKE